MKPATSAASVPVVRFPPFELDRRAGEVRRSGLRVKLQEKPFQILEMLLDRPGEVVTREELRERLWPADTFVDFDASLNTAVNKVRTALGDRAEAPRFVETVGRRGYRFIGPVETAPVAPTVVGTPWTEATTEPAAAATARRPPWAAAAAAIAAAALVAGAFGWSRSHAAASIHSLAVLPLTNLTNDPDQEYFADGMTDALITDLASIRALRVISRQSVMRYKGSRKPLPEIARELDVDAVVEGSVARSGLRVRVIAQLVQARTDRHLWARQYERELGDLLSLEGEVARSIAREIRVALTPEERAELGRVRTTSAEAYEAYLRGRYFWNGRTEEGLQKAVEYFTEATRKDPRFALAYAAIAESYGPMGYLAYLRPAEARAPMKAAATRALELDESLAEAHGALAACLAFYEWSWAAAEKESRRAIELNPSDSTDRLWYGLQLSLFGRFEEELEQKRRAFEADPLNLTVGVGVAVALRDLGREDEAIRQLHKTLELNPQFGMAHDHLAMAYLDQGRCPDALAELGPGGGAVGQSTLGYVYAVCGRPAEARRELADLERRAARRYVPASRFAEIHAGLGERDQAFAWLERAVADREPSLPGIRTDRPFASLRSDPRFAVLLRRMNMPPP